VLVLAACWYFKDAHWPENADLGKVISLTHLVFPPSARLLHGNYIDSDCSCEEKYIRAKVAIRPTDVDSLVKQLRDGMYRISTTDRLGVSDGIRLKPLGEGVTTPRHTWRTPGWWRPGSARKFLAALLQSGYSDTHVLVDLDDPKQAVVYVNYMEH